MALLDEGVPRIFVNVKFNMLPAVMVEVVNEAVLVADPQLNSDNTAEPAVVGVLDARLSKAIVLVPDGVE